MPDEFILKDALGDAFPPWFWGVGAVLAVGCVALLLLFYLEHPDRSIWEDFGKRFDIPDDLSGLVTTSPEDGADPGPG